MYKSFKHFEIFKSYCFFCFMGAESLVYSGAVRRPHDPTSLMLNVGNPEFVAHFMHVYERLLECSRKEQVTAEDAEFFQAYLRNEMQPFNYRDYGNPAHEGIHYRVSEAEERRLMEERMPRASGSAPATGAGIGSARNEPAMAVGS